MALAWLKNSIRQLWYKKMSKEECDLKDRHKEYISYEQFQKKLYYAQLKTLLPEIQGSFLYDKIHKLLEEMSQLTGLLLIIEEKRSRKSLKYYGTGFIARIRRTRSQCDGHSVEPGHPESVSAIVTVTTAYHMFNEDNSDDVDCYEKAKEIWDKYKTEFKLDYNAVYCENGKDSLDVVDLQMVKNLPTLHGHRLLETDKEINYKSDWCAIECTTSNIELIKKLETTLSNFQSSLAELYQLSRQSATYKDVNLVLIIGHPHYWPKTFSLGQCRREKEVLKEIRSYQTWCRYTYDNPVCNGISGAPIFKWGQPIAGFGYWFGHPHNHSELVPETNSDGKDVSYGKSTIGVENIY